MRHLARRLCAAVVGMLLVAAAGGCVASQQSQAQATGAVADALEQASSAVSTADLTVSLLDANRLTPAVADTALLDQVRVLEEASTALTTLVPPDDVSSSARTAGLSALSTAVLAVVTARAWVAGQAGGSLSDAGSVPTEAADVLALLQDSEADLSDALTQAQR